MKHIISIVITVIACLMLLTIAQPVFAYSYKMQQQNQFKDLLDGVTFFGPSWYNKPTNYAQLP
jgi:uncharacterized membrane protein affecting hemolysin expression